MELNVYGEYTPGPWKTTREILDAIHANRDEWFPGKAELREFAASGAGVVEGAVNVWNLLCSIVRHKPSRVNVFTHATAGYIGLSGRVVKGNVYFASGAAAELSPDLMAEASEQGFSFSDAKTKNATMRDVRAALGNASLVIYACHSGLERDYLQRIAKLLKIRVGGFAEEIRYHPTPVAGSIRWQYSIGGGPKVKDFHDLDPIVFVAP